MRLKDVMTRATAPISAETPLPAAIARMREREYAVLPVGEDDRVIGLLVGQDIAERVAAAGRNPQRTTAREAMTTEIVYGAEDQDITEAARLMRVQKVSQLVVLDPEKRFVGIVALDDLPADIVPDTD
jgi:CBS domain-containing protein